MGEPRRTDYEDYRAAQEQLGGPGDEVVEPLEETPEMAAAVEDDTTVTDRSHDGCDHDRQPPAGTSG